MKTSEIEEAMRRDFDADAKMLSIGPAGENAAPLGLHLHRPVPQGRPRRSRRPHGAARTSRPSPSAAPAPSRVGDAKAFLADLYRIHSDFVLTEDNLWANEEGTPILAPDHERRRRHPHAQLVGGHLRRHREHQLRGLPEDPHQEPRLLPVRHRLPPVPRGRRRRRRGPGVRDHRPLRRQLRHRRHRRAHEVQRSSATSGASTPSPPARVVGLAMDLTEKGIHDFGLRFGEVEGYVKAARAHRQARGHRRRAGAGRPRPGRQVRPSRAGHGGQEPGAAGLRPARRRSA